MPTQKKSFLRQKLSSKLIFLLFLILVTFFTIRLSNEYSRNHQIDEEVQFLEAEAKRLENRNLEILGLGEYFNSIDFLEKEARIKLGLVKPEESAIIIQESQDKTVKEEDRGMQKAVSNLKKWREYFFK